MKSRGAAGRLWSQAATFYDEEIQKLVPSYDKCLNNCGNYVERKFKVWRIWYINRILCTYTKFLSLRLMFDCETEDDLK
jgi:hypothetical protein